MDNDSTAAILEQLTEVARDVFMDDTLELKRSDWADDIVGWSSITLVELIIGVQERFAIALTAEETDNLKSVGDLVDVVRRKLLPR